MTGSAGTARRGRIRPWLLVGFVAVVAVAGGAYLLAQRGVVSGGPCSYDEIDIAKWGLDPFENARELRSKGGRLDAVLPVQYTDPSKTSIAGCNVQLRTYGGELVGPTLRLKPGDTLRLKLRNELPVESRAEVARQLDQETANAHLVAHPGSFNTTNLHTHGLHVSPKRNSDNVLLMVPPQSDQDYEIAIPKDHPPGTYWYHAHAHGSTAIQVGSGMAGALIVEDDEADIPKSLRAADVDEKVMVFSSILYNSEGRIDDIAAFFPDHGTAPCEDKDLACTWQRSRRRTTVNGQIVPKITMRPGEVQRWRFIDATFRETLELQLVDHALHEIALDGLYLGKVDTWRSNQSIHLEPGYRSDVLLKASSEPGTYRLVDKRTPASQGLRGVAEDENVLAELVVTGEPTEMSLPTSEDVRELEPFPGVNLKNQEGVFDGVDLTKEKEAGIPIGVQEAAFKIGNDISKDQAQNYFQINGFSFDPGRARSVQLNTTDMWALTTVGDPAGVPSPIPPLPHVFHIHVNPFQTTREGPDGNTEVVWKDTVLIPAGAHMQIYTRYTDFLGRFVTHCHILDHEDLGMMEVVDVVDKLPLAEERGGHEG